MGTTVTDRKHKSKMAWLNAIDIIKLNLKSIIHRKEILFIVLSFFVMAVIVGTIYIPYYGAAPVFYLTYEILPLLIIIGWTGWQMRKTTLYKNIKSSGVGKYSFYIAQFLTIIIIGNILTLFFWSIVWLLGTVGAFKAGWGEAISGVSKAKFNIFSYGSIFLIIYCAELNMLLSFSLYFLLNSFIKDIKVYYTIIISIFLLGIIFGGALNDYYVMPPRHYTYADAIEQVYSAHGEKIIYDPLTRTYTVKEEYLDEILAAQWSMSQFDPNGGNFPESIFIPTLAYPFFGTGQLASAAVGSLPTQDVRWANISVDVIDTSGHIVDTLGAYNTANWLDFFRVDYLSNKGWMWLLVLIQPYIIFIWYLGLGIIFHLILGD